ncbi:hypothetical protein FJV83_28770 [Mesorhizobium sp. WSM4307]|uniref:hypothetical protein n=1 Tax=unclassified Mesorhizobium TaxID=325217 RepID=UPI00115C9294|nr:MULTISPECIES: hypothetical protein [unclassified Mesorhizobium]TRC77687.1 hypothetical protein FJV80_25360 [Mesorhizobium sp. WSM4310]TRC78080.1 hypothetical protein FJV81_11015 [Mesorhizobium sp. WSM4315]TRC79269.1 hypothetical protein FJV83_28770 [Mesorhizobium sp. WSM4307]
MQSSEVLIRRAEVVCVHLNTLEELLNVSKPGVAEALRASLSLRFLFDGALIQTAHLLGHAIEIPAPVLERIPIEEAVLFACGGYHLGAATVSPHYTYREPGPNSGHRPQFESQVASSPSTHVFADIKLSKFLLQPCLGLVGLTISRNATIRYVANKCGGAHHHDDLAGFSELDMRLTLVGHALRVNGDSISAVFLETLGTASLLLASNSIITLRAALAAARTH